MSASAPVADVAPAAKPEVEEVGVAEAEGKAGEEDKEEEETDVFEETPEAKEEAREKSRKRRETITKNAEQVCQLLYHYGGTNKRSVGGGP